WDFFHLDTVLLRRLHVLVFIHHDSRRVRIAGIRSNPVASWVTQQARNLSMELADRANPVKFLVRDRDTKYTASFEVIHRLANDWPDWGYSLEPTAPGHEAGL
ncbi:MAG: hypothetical protein M0Z95_28980, partial [Actinomycetota bacterium]|nr:hypothetical protein [Actinomycetota bacterium]